MTVIQDIFRWLWHLLPANPILVRVVSAGGKRSRHLWARVGYLLALFVVVIVVGSGALGGQQTSLAELAKQATNTFFAVSLLQLFLMSFIAPVFTAAAITQEKNANTFHILLTTPLSSAQIVLGALFSRIYFVWVLLLAGLPIFCITMLYGGVTAREVFESFGLAATTALVTGSLAIMISVAQIGTQRTILSFFLGIALYLLALGALGISSYGALAEAPMGEVLGQPTQMSWLAPLHPFLALLVVTGQTPAPPPSDVFEYSWPWRWMLANPQYGYMLTTTLVSACLVLLSLFFVRRSAKEGERTWFSWLSRRVSGGGDDGERRRKPRYVWHNPIAWREAATRASAGGRSALRWVFVAIGALAGVVLLVAYKQNWWEAPDANALADHVRQWLTVLIWIELAVILLIVTNTAATSLTREKESQTMELLLVTPLTSKYIIAGMARGLVSFALPLIIAPAVMLAVFVFSDLVSSSGPAVTTIEAVVLIPLLMTVFASVAAMVGMHFSLQFKKTVQAVMVSTAAVMGLAGLLWLCGLSIGRGASGTVAAAFLPFMPFPSVQTLVDFGVVFAGATDRPSATLLSSARWTRLVSSLISTGGYAGLAYLLYSGMVRNFDMVVRRQSA